MTHQGAQGEPKKQAQVGEGFFYPPFTRRCRLHSLSLPSPGVGAGSRQASHGSQSSKGVPLSSPGVGAGSQRPPMAHKSKDTIPSERVAHTNGQEAQNPREIRSWTGHALKAALIADSMHGAAGDPGPRERGEGRTGKPREKARRLPGEGCRGAHCARGTSHSDPIPHAISHPASGTRKNANSESTNRRRRGGGTHTDTRGREGGTRACTGSCTDS